MKKTIYVFLLLLLIGLIPFNSKAQSRISGRVETYTTASGEIRHCIVPHGSRQCFAIKTSKPRRSIAQYARRQGNVYRQNNNEDETYGDDEIYDGEEIEAPSIERQSSQTTEWYYSGGIDRYTGRPYGTVVYTTRRVTVTTTTNNTRYRPNIYVQTQNGSYGWPRYP